MLADTLRKFVQRGARANISKLLGKVRPEDVALLLHGLTAPDQLEVFQILTADYPDSAGEVLTEMERTPRRARPS